MNRPARERVLIVGPQPPPDTGVTVPNKLFCDWLAANRGGEYDVRVVASNSGDKSLVSLYHPAVLLKLAGIARRILVGSLRSDRVIVYGSNRFVTVVGCGLALLMRPFRKPVSLRVVGGAYEQYLESRPAPFRRLIRRCMRLARCLVVETRHVANALASVWPQQIRCVPNYRLPVTNDARRIFASDFVRFVFCGNVRRTKGCGELFRAFYEVRRRLADEQSNVRVALDVYGPFYSVPAEAVDGLDEARNDPDIALHGPVANDVLRDALRKCDVFVFPTYWPTEGHSGAVIEALFYGLPVIASDWRANREVIEDGVNGLICRPHDVESLADCMLRLALNPQLRERLSAGALDATERFSAAVVCPKLADAFGL